MKKFRMVLFGFFINIMLLLSSSCSVFKVSVNFIVDNQVYSTVELSNSVIEMPEDPQKEGYVFDGWYWDEGEWNEPLSTLSLLTRGVKKENNVYAKWEIITDESSGSTGGDDSNGDSTVILPTDEEDTAEFKGHVYKVFKITMSWEEAKAYCEELGGHLATITSAEEQAVLEQFNGSYWLGATDVEVEGEWKWITGEEWNYENWLEGEPNNAGEEHYLVIWPKTWNDLCNDSWEQCGFICEWE